jgi:hypothetical protein
VFPRAPVRQSLTGFPGTRAKTFRDQPPAGYDPLHPPLLKPGLESEPEEAKPKKRPAANDYMPPFPNRPSHSLPRKRGRVRW